MMANYCRIVLNLVSLLCLLLLPVPILAQTAAEKKLQAKTNEKETSRVNEADLLEAQRRSFAISLVISLADDARSYDDLALLMCYGMQTILQPERCSVARGRRLRRATPKRRPSTRKIILRPWSSP
jgi:hypothetical protein